MVTNHLNCCGQQPHIYEISQPRLSLLPFLAVKGINKPGLTITEIVPSLYILNATYIHVFQGVRKLLAVIKLEKYLIIENNLCPTFTIG